MWKLDTPPPEVSRRLALWWTVLSISKVKWLVKSVLETQDKKRVKQLQWQLESLLKSSSWGAPRLIQTIRSQVRLLSKWQEERGEVWSEELHLQKCMSKSAFLQTLDTVFHYDGKNQTIRQALASAIFRKNTHWIHEVSAIFRSYNTQFPSILWLPISLDGVSLCLRWWEKSTINIGKNGRIKKQEFIEICALDPEGKQKSLPLRERFLQALDGPSEKGSSVTLRTAIQEALTIQQVSTHWFATIKPVLISYNASVEFSSQTLPIHFQSIGQQCFGNVSLKKTDFCTLCGIGVPQRIQEEKEKAVSIPRKRAKKPVIKKNKNPWPIRPKASKKSNPLFESAAKEKKSSKENGTLVNQNIIQAEPLVRLPRRDRVFEPTDDMIDIGWEWYWKKTHERVKWQ